MPVKRAFTGLKMHMAYLGCIWQVGRACDRIAYEGLQGPFPGLHSYGAGNSKGQKEKPSEGLARVLKSLPVIGRLFSNIVYVVLQCEGRFDVFAFNYYPCVLGIFG